MAKYPPRLSVLNKIQAKQSASAQPSCELSDLGNLVFAARRALSALGGHDLANVTNSILKAEAVLEASMKAQQAAAAPAIPPADQPPEPAKG